MTWLRGILIVLVTIGLSALAGGLVAAAIDGIAPGYYPGVFPPAHMNGHARATGILQGVAQGAGLGGMVALAFLIYGGLSGELRWHSLFYWCLFIAALGLIGGIVGGSIGVAIGTEAPDTYYALAVRYERITRGTQETFSPRDVGLGLGAAQGLLVAAVTGSILMAGAGWWQYRQRTRGSAKRLRITPPDR